MSGPSSRWPFWIGGIWSCPWSLIAGLGGWGLHCIGHDCGHGSFSRNRRLNFVIGHLALLPLLYPFHAWRHVHNWHHAHTNSLELDTDWRPIPEAVYRRMPLRHRLLYVEHAHLGGMGRVDQLLDAIGSSPFVFPEEGDAPRRAPVTGVRHRRGRCIPAALTYFTGWQGLLLYFVAPWFAIHAWFSITTLMHHSAEDIPYLPEEYWTRNASKLLVTTDLRLSAVAAVPHPQHLAAHRTSRVARRTVLPPRQGTGCAVAGRTRR